MADAGVEEDEVGAVSAVDDLAEVEPVVSGKI